jgi:uncharacterized ferritin-like protein (DUF455 family)
VSTLRAFWDEAALEVLAEADPHAKAALAERILGAAETFDLSPAPRFGPRGKPARPAKPELVPPQEVPRRGPGTAKGKAALLHALAHIELNAVDLAADMALRFAGAVPDEDRATFVADWFKVMGEEGLHFRLLHQRLSDLGYAYGDFPAHSGLWDAAEKTAEDILARLAIGPMILEARGLDVTPGLIRKMEGLGDRRTAGVLTRIYNDEIGHVRAGVFWFESIAKTRGLHPEETFHKCVMTYYPQGPKRPFNDWARSQAAMPRDWYEGVAS